MAFFQLESGNGFIETESGARLLLESGIEVVERPHLLPATSADQEKNVSKSAGRFDDIPTADLKKLWSPSECPVEFLPWLAWAVHVDYWDTTWTEQQKRDAIANSLDDHKAKGSVQSVIDAVGLLGWTAAVVENEGTFHNGRYTRDGTRTRNGRVHFKYDLNITYAGTLTTDEKNRIRALAETAAPVRCHLINITEV